MQVGKTGTTAAIIGVSAAVVTGATVVGGQAFFAIPKPIRKDRGQF
jgi:hypothetical protein